MRKLAAVIFLFSAVLATSAALTGGADAATYNCTSCASCSEYVQNSSSWDTVQLIQNISGAASTCVQFYYQDNITFDCQNYNITGTGAGEAGIEFNYSVNVSSGLVNASSYNNTIQNCNVSGFENGIFIQKGANHTLLNITVSNNDIGMWLYQTDNNTLDNITANANTYYGIELDGVINHRISNITVQENTWLDIEYLAGSGKAMCNNLFTNVIGSGGRAIEFYNYSATIQDKVLSQMILCNATNSIVDNVTIIGSAALDNNNLRIMRSENVTVSNINSSDNYIGLDVEISITSNSTFSDIIANENSEHGIRISSIRFSNFENITANSNSGGNGRGIYVELSSNNTFTNVTTNLNTVGMWVYGSDYNVITNVTVKQNTNNGFRVVGGANYNTINDSYIENNTNYGVFFTNWGSLNPTDNTFYNNYFNNTVNYGNSTPSSGTIFNYFNTTRRTGLNILGGPWIGGNYWTGPGGNFSDTCTDADSDGVCDSAYNLEENNYDYHALNATQPTACNSCSDCSGKIQSASLYDTVYMVGNVSTSGSSCVDFVGKDNVTLDCLGSTIIGGTWYGINMNSSNGGSNNVTIRNCSATEWSQGFYLQGSGNNTLLNINSYGNDYGVRFSSSVNNTIADSALEGNSNYDFDIAGGGASCLHELTNVTGSGGRAIEFYHTNATVQDKVLSELVLCGAHGANVSNVDIIGTLGMFEYGNPLIIASTENATISGVNSSYNSNGIVVGTDSNFNNFTNITASYNSNRGISIGLSNYNNTFTDITLINNDEDGVWIDSGISNIFTDMVIQGSTHGMHFYRDSSQNSISNSSIVQNTYGLYFYNFSTSFPDYNNFFNNLFNNTANTYNSTNMTNYFNTTNVSGTNIVWGPNTGGNYWGNASGTEFSDTCTELNDTGYCNESYAPDGGNFDYLPLVRYPCPESWTCGSWSSCSGSTQTRTCTDATACGTIVSRPAISRSCDDGNGGGGSSGSVSLPPAEENNASRMPVLVPGVGLRNNTKLQEALQKVLAISNMNERAVSNMMRLSESIISEIEVTREIEIVNTTSTFTTRIANIGADDIKDLIFYDVIPKGYAGHVDNMTITAPGAAYEIVEEDPEIVFTYPELSPDDAVTITYEIDNDTGISVIDDFGLEIYAYEEELCTPGSERCQDSRLERCGSDGSVWETLEECAYGCAGDACIPSPDECTGGQCGQPINPAWLLVPGIIAAVIAVVFVLNYTGNLKRIRRTFRKKAK